jgi:Tectonin domain/PQQ-like domain
MQASPPQPIGSLWPHLPDSFELSVSGACTGVGGGGSLTLFNGSRYVSTDGALPLSKLTAIPGWPQTPNWKDGLFDAIYAGPIGQGWFHVVSNGEFMLVDPAGQGRILEGPGPFSQTDASKAVPASWGAKLDGGIALPIGGVAAAWYFRGTAMASSAATPAQLQYLGNLSASWPATWHLVLRHAPNGRDGNLWSVLPTERASWILQHNGDAWTQVNNQADHVGVGQDNTVMIASAQRLWLFTGPFDGTGFTPVSAESNLIQVSLGNANTVFALDSGNNVYSFDPASGALAQNTNAGTAIHIATTNDGTLWHAKPNDSNMHRLLTTSDLPGQVISVQQDLIGAVTKVAATGFGAAHCLAQDSQGNAQAYRYDSPYVFASVNNYEISALGYSQIAQGLGNVYFVDFLSNSVVAVDVHTGAEASRSAPSSADGSTAYTNVVFDAAHQLVYVGTYHYSDWLDRTTPGQLLALDARDLSKVVWSFNATAGINIRPSLVGNVLLFGDRNGTIYAFDTVAAAAAPANVQPRASWMAGQINLSGGVTYTGVPDGGMATLGPAIAVGDK